VRYFIIALREIYC